MKQRRPDEEIHDGAAAQATARGPGSSAAHYRRYASVTPPPQRNPAAPPVQLVPVTDLPRDPRPGWVESLGVDLDAVQLRASDSPANANVHETAARGIAGARAALPHADMIQRAFGHHDISGARAQVGGPAAEACTDIGATAYATGDHVAFASAPDLHTAAHEAAHVVQQRGGVQLKGGVGQAGDTYEQHADAVADRVVQGKSAVDLLDQFASGSVGSGATVQKKSGKARSNVRPDLTGTKTGERTGLREPFRCSLDSKGKPGCMLDGEQRIDARRQLGENLLAIVSNFDAALNATERDRIARARGNDGTGWKMIINIFFSLGSRGLGSAVAALLDRYKPLQHSWKMVTKARSGASAEDIEAYGKTLAAARAGAISTTMSSLGRGARAVALAKARKAGARGAEPSVLIQVMRQSLQKWRASVSGGLRKLDDHQLIAIHAHLDPVSRYTSEYFKRRIGSLFSQVLSIGSYRTQGLVKKRVPGTLKQAVRIRAYGKARMALCYASQTPAQMKEHKGLPDIPWHTITVKNIRARFTKGDLEKLSEHLKRAHFIRWIDNDLAKLAEEANKLYVGEVLTFDLTDGRDDDKITSGSRWQDGYWAKFKGPNKEIARWVKRARMAAKRRSK